ncbi:F-box and associated interaction domains-containing protein [Striga asiatica]|uniref:F-box and associated interaction domains-containing protein n=1 Tax=Striga asiatica TaxID=4170 RepID=A0A5A7QT11_STRAF|nr:F-box and associated interaction domains-containing protein [Striga asiatica]
MEGSPYLSEDLFVEILARLPVQSLLRLRTVSKSWKTIIAGPKFCSFHLSTNRHSSKILLAAKYPKQVSGRTYPVERYLLLDNHHHRPADSSCLSPLDFPFQYPLFTSPHIVASINGLICVSVRAANKVQPNIPFMLWNPTIRRHVCLPEITLTKPNYSYTEFGYDPTTDDYKIVVLTAGIPEFNVYSLNSNAWRRGFLDHRIRLFSSTGAFAGGKMHWLVFKDFQNNTDYWLYSFDVATEVFAEVALPPKDRADTFIYPHVVTVLGDSLVVGQALKSKHVMFGMTWTIWEQIGAGGWKKLYRVEDPMAAFVCVLKNEEWVMDKIYFGCSDHGLAAYEPKASEFKLLEPLSSFPQQRKFGDVASLNDHQQSLVLLDCTPLGDPHTCWSWSSCQVQIKRKTPSALGRN